MTKPKIRIQGFEEEWKNVELGELGHTMSGVGFPDSEQGQTEGFPFYKVSDMNLPGNEYRMSRSNNYVSQYQVDTNHWRVLYDTPAILFAKVGAAVMLNRKRIVDSPCLFDNNMMVYVLSSFWDTSFARSFFESIDFKRFVQTGALPSINGKEVEFACVHLPSDKKEQKVLGEYFDIIDTLVSKSQDKLNSLKSLKICYLNRLFPIGGGRKIPPIRLEGFSGEWEVKKLKDLTNRITRKNTGLVSNRALTISAQYGLIEQESFFNSRIASSNLANYYLLYKGEFAYNKSTSQGYPFGAVKRLDLYESGVLSTLYIVFEINDNIVDSDYLAAYFNTTLWHNEIRLRAAEGARNHGLLNISAEDFFDINIYLPKSLDEQKTIGKYFKEMEQLIYLHSEELERLKQLKQSCLESMFVNP